MNYKRAELERHLHKWLDRNEHFFDYYNPHPDSDMTDENGMDFARALHYFAFEEKPYFKGEWPDVDLKARKWLGGRYLDVVNYIIEEDMKLHLQISTHLHKHLDVACAYIRYMSQEVVDNYTKEHNKNFERICEAALKADRIRLECEQ